MFRNLCTFLFLAVLSMSVHAATITSAASGNLSAGATWVGGVAPNCTSDNIVIAATHAVTVDINCTIGTSASAAGLGLSVANSATASLIVPTGVTLTMRGFDQSTNAIANVQQNGSLVCQTGGTILLDVASDWQADIVMNGNLTSNGCHWSIPTANINWNNTSAANTYSPAPVGNPYDLNNSIYVIKLFTWVAGTGSTGVPGSTFNVMTPGPISNGAGTALGSFGGVGASSISIGSGGFSGTTSTEVSSYAAITNPGDYFVDYEMGVVWYKGGTTLTISLTFKYATWFGSGIIATANTTGSAVIFNGNTVDHLGSNGMSVLTSNGEFTGMFLWIADKFAPSINAGRGFEAKNNTFTHCSRPLAIYPNQHSLGSATTTNHMQVTGNAFNYIEFQQNGAGFTGHVIGSTFTNGAIQSGYTIFTDFTGNTFNMFAPIFNGIIRGTPTNNNVSSNTGQLTTDGLLPTGSVSSTFDSNNFKSFSSTMDTATFNQGGGVGTPNVYTNNVMGYGKRAGRMDNNMTVNHNIFYRNYHHAFVQRSATGYVGNYSFTNNVIYDDLNAGDLPGGFTFGYNTQQWLDNITVQHNTFDRGTRCLEFNDLETTIVLSTRINVLDNICSNGIHGYYRPPDDANNVTKLALSRIDFNDDYNQTGAGSTATNVQQAQFTKGGVEYNGSTRNIAGVFIFNPCVAAGVPTCSGGYTLPDATSRSLVLTVAGVEGVNKSFKLAWSGGTQVEYVLNQGTASGAGTTSTLVDSTKAFTVNAFRSQQVYIFSGTGAGQFGMIKSNTATVLTIIANTATSVWTTAPDATSVYVILNSDQKLFDSGGTAFIEAGIHSPTLTQANGTYTDSAITMSTHQFNVNPTYVSNPTALGPSADLHSTNATLLNTGSDGVTIGAFPTITSGSVTPTIAKSFSPTSIPITTNSALTFVITNPNTSTLSGVAVSDTLPTGVVVATPNGLTGSCGSGTITAVTGSGIVALTGGTMTASSTCMYAVNVTGNTAGVKSNTTGTISSTEAGTGATSNTATLTVIAPPTIAKSFTPTSIALGANSALSFTITNPGAVTLSGVAVTDTLPSGVVVATPNGLTGSCGSGTITAVAGSGSVSLSGGTLTSSGTCTFGVNVTGSTAGQKSNTTGTITSTEGGTGATSNTVVLSVVIPPTVVKSFTPTSVALNGASALSFTITNPNASALTSVAVSDSLPAGMVVSTPNGLTGTCGSGTITAIAASSSIDLTGGTLTSSGTCTFGVNVKGTTAGVKSNTTGTISSTESGTGVTSNTATLTVNAPPTIAKSFSPTSVSSGGTSALTFVITNPNVATLSGVAFSDTLPSGVVVATPNGLSGACGSGTVTAVAGAGTVSLASGTIATSGTCTFSVNVTASTVGSAVNTTGNVSATEGGTGTTSNTATLTVTGGTIPPTISKSFSPSTVNVAVPSTLTFALVNPNSSTLSGVAFSDTLPTGVVVATPNGVSGTCGSGTVTAVAASNTIALSGGTMTSSGACTFSVNVVGSTLGVKFNTTGTVSATESGTGATSNTASLLIAVPGDPQSMVGSGSDNCVGSINHTQRVVIPINIAASTKIISGVAGTRFSFCLINVGPVGTANNVALVEGSGTLCATNTLGITTGTTAATGWIFPIGGRMIIGNGMNAFAETQIAGNDVCLILSGATQVSGFIQYAP